MRLSAAAAATLVAICAALARARGAVAASRTEPIQCSPWEGVDLIAPGPTTPFGVLQAAGAEECALHSTADPRVYGSVLWSMLHLFARWYPRTSAAPRAASSTLDIRRH